MNDPSCASRELSIYTITTSTGAGVRERPMAPDGNKPGGRGAGTRKS